MPTMQVWICAECLSQRSFKDVARSLALKTHNLLQIFSAAFCAGAYTVEKARSTQRRKEDQYVQTHW